MDNNERHSAGQPRGKQARKQSRKQARKSTHQGTPSILSPGQRHLELSGATLLAAALMIGPLLAGSYFGAWRWPLIITSSLAAILLLPHSRGNQKTNWWLAALLIWPALQGLWMWHNAWGEFSRLSLDDLTQPPWNIRDLDNQPFSLLPGTADRAETMDRLTYIIPCLGLIWGTRQLLISRPSWLKHLADSIFLTGVAVALLGLIQRWSGAEGIFWDETMGHISRHLFFGTFRSPGIATCFLNVALAMSLSSLISPRSSRKRQRHPTYRISSTILRLCGVAVILTAVMTAGSKTGMGLGLLTLILWGSFNRRAIAAAYHRSAKYFPGNSHRDRNIVTGTLLLITLLAILSLAGTIFKRWQEAHEGDYASLTGRGVTNVIQLKMIQDPEWGALGHGPGSFYPLFPYFAKDQPTYGVYVYSHNDPLQTLVEWGWLGSACFTTIIAGALYFLIRNIFYHKDKHPQHRVIFMRGYLIAISTFLIHSNIDFPFQIESLAITFSIMIGVAWAIPELTTRKIKNAHR
ncbi:MAG: O-antigen ligase family protein [Verrucomicrobiae bacterium]|nr:O-antigen ligase family protein [Verrucomicrobiae bacterium]NNJ44032.1 hypothetical protein [Akkermansiaceae bacterium]